jgi:NitT/TauT family transport system substrate-binding protein
MKILHRSIRALRIATASILVGLFSLTGALAQQRVVVGAASKSELASPIFLAEERGWFREAGLAVEVIDFRGGAPAVQALVGGGVQICICAVDHVVRLQNRNIDGVLAVALDTRHSYALVARGDATFTDLASLKGRRIGITSPGSFTDNTLRWALKKAGMNPDRDVEILGAGTGATMRAAIDSRRVDAGMVISSDLVHSLATAPAHGYKVVVDWRTLAYPSLGLLARRSWLADPNSGAAAFNAVVVRGLEAIRSDRAAATAALKKQFPNFSDAVLAELAADLQTRLAPAGKLREQELANLHDMLAVSAPELRPVTLANAQPFAPAGR